MELDDRTAAAGSDGEAEHYRRLEREWQNDVGYALLDKPYEMPGSAAVFNRQMDRIIALLDLDEPAVVVEIGCGKGHLLRRLRDARRSAPLTLVGLDISRAVHSLPAEGLEGVQAQGEHLPFSDGCADYIIYDGSLHHCIDYSQALRDALRVLAPDGSLILFEPVSSRFSQLMHRLLDPIVFKKSVVYESPIDIHYKAYFSLDAIKRELRDHGLELRESKSDFLAYPFTGCYAGSPFARSARLLPMLIAIEDLLDKIPLLRGLVKVFAWRFTLVATKPKGPPAPP